MISEKFIEQLLRDLNIKKGSDKWINLFEEAMKESYSLSAQGMIELIEEMDADYGEEEQ